MATSGRDFLLRLQRSAALISSTVQFSLYTALSPLRQPMNDAFPPTESIMLCCWARVSLGTSAGAALSTSLLHGPASCCSQGAHPAVGTSPCSLRHRARSVLPYPMSPGEPLHGDRPLGWAAVSQNTHIPSSHPHCRTWPGQNSGPRTPGFWLSPARFWHSSFWARIWPFSSPAWVRPTQLKLWQSLLSHEFIL